MVSAEQRNPVSTASHSPTPPSLQVLTLKDLTTQQLPSWCGGCGDFNILFALKNALVELNKAPEEVVIVTGIGCGSKSNHFVKTYGFEGLHGRPLPVATG
ncbi:MAG: hypothetical protein HY520_00775, partial [Candidatus Aenigmarchaeota archaeon]|nr:hypothetical protein [Candidatus Aenigmarchaeota archaeon]